MVISCKPGPKPDALVVVFERDGEEPRRIRVANGKKALLRAVGTLLAYSNLHAGDCLKIEIADTGCDGGHRPHTTPERSSCFDR